MTLPFLIQKEIIQIRRNAFLPRLIFIFPIVMICVMPWVMNQEVKNIVVEVVDLDHSSSSRRLVQRVEESRYFIFHGQSSTYAEALSLVEKGKVDVILEVPHRYHRDLVNGRQPQVLIAANAGNATKGSMGSAYLSQIVSAHVSPATSQMGMAIQVVNLYNNRLSYKIFMIPALTGILLMLLCGFLPALNIVSEKEKGTIEQINVTPIRKWEFILAKLIPYWAMAMIVLTLCLILSWLVYGITCQGPLWLVYALALVLAFFFSGLGLCISNYSDNMMQAVFVMWFFVLVLMLMSGMFTPVASMPDWAQYIVTANPMHYFIDAVRTIFVRGGTLQSISHQLIILGGIALVMDACAVASYRKNS